MSPDKRDRTLLLSDGSALVLTGAALAAFLIGSQNLWRVVPAPVRDAGIELSLESAPAETPPAPPPPVPPKIRTLHLKTIPLAVVPSPVPLPVDPPEQVPADAAVIAAPSVAAAPAPMARPDLEARYAAELRADIDRRTHPPDSPQYRLHHPAGAVRVRFAVRRSGEPNAVAVEVSSGSPILDQAASNIVSSGHYAPMPPKAFLGESEHTFVVTIEFRQANYASL